MKRVRICSSSCKNGGNVVQIRVESCRRFPSPQNSRGPQVLQVWWSQSFLPRVQKSKWHGEQELEQTTLLQLLQSGPLGTELPWKRARGQGTVAIFALCQSINANLPAASIRVNGVQCTALIDTNDGMSHACCVVGVILIIMEGGDCAKVAAQVVRDKPLGYDLLIGIDGIRELGGIVIRPTGEV